MMRWASILLSSSLAAGAVAALVGPSSVPGSIFQLRQTVVRRIAGFGGLAGTRTEESTEKREWVPSWNDNAPDRHADAISSPELVTGQRV